MMMQVVMFVLNDGFVDDGWSVVVVTGVVGTNYAQRGSRCVSVVAVGRCDSRETVVIA